MLSRIPRNLFSRRVLVCTETGDFKAVMNPGGRPLHLAVTVANYGAQPVTGALLEVRVDDGALRKNYPVPPLPAADGSSFRCQTPRQPLAVSHTAFLS